MAEKSQTSASAEVSSQANAPKDPRPVYEVGFHVVPTVDEAKAASIMDTIRTAITKDGAEVISEQIPQKMQLAYIIERTDSSKHEKFSESYFGFIKFATEREYINALEAMLRSMKEVLRYLLITTSRDEAPARRAVFVSDRLEGETIKKPVAAADTEKKPEVSEDELNKSLDALVS